jgi:hypothetical protein
VLLLAKKSIVMLNFYPVKTHAMVLSPRGPCNRVKGKMAEEKPKGGEHGSNNEGIT